MDLINLMNIIVNYDYNYDYKGVTFLMINILYYVIQVNNQVIRFYNFYIRQYDVNNIKLNVIDID